MSRAAFAGNVAGSGAGSGAGGGTGSGAGSGAGRGTTHININTRSVVASWHFGSHMDTFSHSYGHIFALIWTHFGTHVDAFWDSYGRILALIWTHVSWTLGRIRAGNILIKNENGIG